MKVLLVSPPYRPPTEGTLAVATLRPILEAAGHTVEELHGSVLFPSGSRVAPALFHWNCQFAFGRALSNDPLDVYVQKILRSMVVELDPSGVISPDRRNAWATFGVDETQMPELLKETVLQAETCLERMCQAAIARGPYDVVAFSIMFTDQVPPSIYVARRLKQHWPDLKICAGGSVCFEEQADGLLASFGEIDAACHTEGEAVVVPLVEALGGKGALDGVPGIAWRDGDGSIRHNAAPTLLRDLDSIPMPDYDGFFAALADSEWAGRDADLFFETSRGCWWGEKSLCTFCGLNADGLPYRAKSPERAYDEITRLHARYPQATFLRAADNILDLRYFKQLFPRLHDLARDPVRPLRLFYEVKSNMKPEQVEAMADGGVREVQAGIESFADGVLEVMRKGCTALGQVQFVKWAHQSGIVVSYNILVLNPGEETKSYDEMLELLPYILHLPPPLGTAATRIERFSPYHAHPEEFGIANVRPHPFFRDVFGPNADPRLAYKFDGDHPIYRDEEHLARVRALVSSLRRWQERWRPDTAYYLDDGERVIIVDQRPDAEEPATTLTGLHARIFRYLDANRSRKMVAQAFPDLDAQLVDTLLLTWLHRRWVCRAGDRWLAVLPRKGPAPAARHEVPMAKAPLRLQLVSA